MLLRWALLPKLSFQLRLPLALLLLLLHGALMHLQLLLFLLFVSSGVPGSYTQTLAPAVLLQHHYSSSTLHALQQQQQHAACIAADLKATEK